MYLTISVLHISFIFQTAFKVQHRQWDCDLNFTKKSLCLFPIYISSPQMRDCVSKNVAFHQWTIALIFSVDFFTFQPTRHQNTGLVEVEPTKSEVEASRFLPIKQNFQIFLKILFFSSSIGWKFSLWFFARAPVHLLFQTFLVQNQRRTLNAEVPPLRQRGRNLSK